jgi:hypothetical protein
VPDLQALITKYSEQARVHEANFNAATKAAEEAKLNYNVCLRLITELRATLAAEVGGAKPRPRKSSRAIKKAPPTKRTNTGTAG